MYGTLLTPDLNGAIQTKLDGKNYFMYCSEFCADAGANKNAPSGLFCRLPHGYRVCVSPEMQLDERFWHSSTFRSIDTYRLCPLFGIFVATRRLLSASRGDMTFTKAIFKCSLGLILGVSTCFNGQRFIMFSLTILQVVILDQSRSWKLC